MNMNIVVANEVFEEEELEALYDEQLEAIQPKASRIRKQRIMAARKNSRRTKKKKEYTPLGYFVRKASTKAKLYKLENKIKRRKLNALALDYDYFVEEAV